MNCTHFEEASLSRKLKCECQDVRDKLAAVKEVGPPFKDFSFFLSFSFYCLKQFLSGIYITKTWFPKLIKTLSLSDVLGNTSCWISANIKAINKEYLSVKSKRIALGTNTVAKLLNTFLIELS